MNQAVDIASRAGGLLAVRHHLLPDPARIQARHAGTPRPVRKSAIGFARFRCFNRTHLSLRLIHSPLHCLVCIAAWSEAVTRFRKGAIQQQFQHLQDRLLHHAEIINMKGESYRLKDKQLTRVADLARGAKPTQGI